MIPEPPNPQHPHLREIVEQERLAEVLSGLGVSGRKVDDVIAGFSFLVGERPDIFARESETGWSRVVMKAFPPDIPLIRIWFTYDDDHVYIEHVELLEE